MCREGDVPWFYGTEHRSAVFGTHPNLAHIPLLWVVLNFDLYNKTVVIRVTLPEFWKSLQWVSITGRGHEIYNQLVRSASGLRPPNWHLVSGAWACCWWSCIWSVEPGAASEWRAPGLYCSTSCEYFKSIREQGSPEAKQPAQDSM